MYKPIEILRCHSLQNRFITSKPCIKLFTDLSVEFSPLNKIAILINCFPYKIWCTTILWCRITPLATNFICGMVIVVVICVNNKTSCVCPIFPPLTSNSCFENLTCFVNAYIRRSIFLFRKQFIKPLENVSWRFRFWKFGPCNDNSTWCTCCFNTI